LRHNTPRARLQGRVDTERPKQRASHANPFHSAGRLLVMKGHRPTAELEEVTTMGENPRAVALRVPGLDEQRHAVVVERRAAGPSSG